MRSEVRNEPVLGALRTLTRKDFGYEKRVWNKWWEQSGRAVAEQQERARHKSTAAASIVLSPRKTVAPPTAGD